MPENNIVSLPFLLVVLSAALAAAVPLMLAAVGEIVGEQSGVLNLGLEGILLVGAFVGFVAAYTSDSVIVGFGAAVIAGLIASLPMVAAVRLGLDQIVVGLAVYLGGLALTSIAFDALLAASNPRIPPGAWWVALVAIGFAIAVWQWMARTRLGLVVRATGLNPRAVDTVGGSVPKIRMLSVLFGGATAGLAGAYLSLQVVGSFTSGMTHGLGFLAIVLAMLVRERVWLGILSALIYGLLVSLGTASQLTTLSISSDVIEIVPFVLVIVVLLFARFRTASSALLGSSYTRS